MKNNKGITLLTLVVTIVVLIILAGITINATLGDNGIINKAQESKNKLEDAVNSDQEKLNSLLDEFNNIMDTSYISIQESHTTTSITLIAETNMEDVTEYEFFIDGKSYGKQKDKTFTTNITLENKDPYIPSGFTHTEGTIDTGYVIQDITLGNEFVWIPVKSKTFTAYATATNEEGNTKKSSEITIEISELTRELNAGGNVITYTEWEEIEGSIDDKKSIAYFKESVIRNSGFYIGRYEMGMPEQKSGDDPVLGLNIAERNIKGVPVCVANVMPWTYIDWETAKENLESMYNEEVQSAMLNSYARTTTINLIGGSISGNTEYTFWPGENLYFKGHWIVTNYSNIIESGNQLDYIRGEAFLKGSPNGETLMLETGAFIKDGENGEETHFISYNICDLVGNSAEWSTEKKIDSSLRRASGGSFNSGYTTDGNLTMYIAGYDGSMSISSRPILYK